MFVKISRKMINDLYETGECRTKNWYYFCEPNIHGDYYVYRIKPWERKESYRKYQYLGRIDFVIALSKDWCYLNSEE